MDFFKTTQYPTPLMSVFFHSLCNAFVISPSNKQIVQDSHTRKKWSFGYFLCWVLLHPSKDITAVWCAPSSVYALSPWGNGYEWWEDGSDNHYYTEHICGYFYYYDASF